MFSFETANCEACGEECSCDELRVVRLAGWKTKLKICDTCQSKSSEESFESAANILKNIEKLASSADSPEDRLAQIVELLNGSN